MGRSSPALRLRKRITMKNILLLSIVSLALLQPVVEAIFLGPIAVGGALGALAVGKGLILGSILSQRRSTLRSGRSYTSYNRRTHYSQPRTYYSSSNHRSYRGKRFAAAEPINMEELARLKRD